ncbi:MAG: ATP-dependent protease ATPase subunit HslU [Cytophagales bacterium]
MDSKEYLTTRQIVAELDAYIIGQSNAKKTVSIALRNRWRRMNVPKEMQKEISPNNILMIGSTGVGKTEIARRLAKLADAPFVKVEASKFTEVGYVGRDVESMVRDLAEQAISLVKAQKKEEVKQKASEVVTEILLNHVIPPVTSSGTKGNFAINGFGEKHENFTPNQEDQELNEKTRERFREKIKNGELDDRKIEIDIQVNSSASVGFVGGPSGIDEGALQGIQDMLSNIAPKKTKKRKVTIEEARKILLEEEWVKLIDMEEVKAEAIAKAENTGIIFIDEIDKIARASGSSSGADVSREGVQRDLLPIVEGSLVSTKHGVINTQHVLFIAAGAFHVSKPSDLIPELQGRFPIRVELEKLSKNDFYRILKEPKSALTKQYEALLKAEEVNLTFNDDALEAIADTTFQINNEIENIGARRLHTVMSHLLNEILFDVPDLIPRNSHIVVTKELVEERLSGLVKNRDMARYIL